MRILPFSEEALSAAISVLTDGGIVAHATETCYGFACDLSNKQAVERLFQLKKRDTSKPVSGLFESVHQAEHYVLWNEKAEDLAAMYLPGPLTIIVPLKDGANLYPVASGTSTSIGVRISSSAVASALVHAFGAPISTTSANVAAKPNPYCAEEIVQQFAEQALQPDLIVDSGSLPPTPPSTVVNLADAHAVLRSGDISL